MLAAAPLAAELTEGLIAAWDFSQGIQGEAIIDLGPHRVHGVIVNLPVRAMRGWNWDGRETNWTHAPEQYGAIHFHEDDLVDACWAEDFRFVVPEDLRSGVYAAHLTTLDFEYWVPFFVVPSRGVQRVSSDF